MELSKEALEYAENLAIVVKDLMSKGLTLDEAIKNAALQYEIRQRQFSLMLNDEAFRMSYISQLKRNCNSKKNGYD